MARKKPFTLKEYKNIYSKVPKLCVEVVLRTNAGIVLTQRAHDSWSGLWHLPGGSVMYREAVVDAVKRISREELDIDVVVGDLLGYIEYWSEEKERGFGYSVTLPFLCTTEDTLPSINQDGETIKVFETIPLNTIEEHKKFLGQNLQMKEAS